MSPQRLRCLLAVAVLVVPVAIVAPGFVRGERNRAEADSSLSQYARTYAPPPPFHWRQSNERLLAGIVAHVPSHASVAVAGGKLDTGWTRWLAYVIAPRQLTNVPTRWTIVFAETPREAQLRPAHAWRYGRDWLVER